MMKVPTYDSLMNPLLRALFELGGSGSISEINEKILEIEKIPENIASIPHDPESGYTTEVAYRLAWARTYLGKFGFLENSSRGVWALTPKAKKEKEVDPQEVIKSVRKMFRDERGKKKPKKANRQAPDGAPILEVEDDWRGELHHILTNALSADSFERT